MPKLSFPLLLLLAACAGYHARHDVLLPSMRSAWGDIKAACEREAAVNGGVDAVAQADAAMQAGTESAIAAVPWAVVDALAEADTVRRAFAGEIGPAVAVLLRERNDRFRESRNLFLGINP